MKKTRFIMGLLLVGGSAVGYAEERRGFHVSAAVGPGVHLGAGLGYSFNRHLSLGTDFAYSYLPLAPQARGGGNRAYWGLVTLTGAAFVSSRVSPYAVVGYGRGRYVPSWSASQWGNAGALGAGLEVRLGSRVSLSLEARLAVIDGITAADGGHAELPVRLGVRFRL